MLAPHVSCVCLHSTRLYGACSLLSSWHELDVRERVSVKATAPQSLGRAKLGVGRSPHTPPAVACPRSVGSCRAGACDARLGYNCATLVSQRDRSDVLASLATRGLVCGPWRRHRPLSNPSPRPGTPAPRRYQRPSRPRPATTRCAAPLPLFVSQSRRTPSIEPAAPRSHVAGRCRRHRSAVRLAPGRGGVSRRLSEASAPAPPCDVQGLHPVRRVAVVCVRVKYGGVCGVTCPLTRCPLPSLAAVAVAPHTPPCCPPATIDSRHPAVHERTGS